MHQFKPSAAALLAMTAAAAFADNAFAVVCTWSGATNGNWSVSGNWSCPGGPSTGDDLVFPDGAITLLMNQDIANLSVNSLNFSGSVGTFTLSGTGNLTISGGAAITSKADTVHQNTLALTNPLKFGAPTAVIDTTTNNRGTLNLNGPLDLNGSVLSFVWDATVPRTYVSGVISGNGGLAVNGIGGDYGLFLSGDNTFTGPVTVNSGYVSVNHAHALGTGGSAANGTTVSTGGTFVLGADTTNENLTLAGGDGTSGNGIMQSGGLHVWGGPVVLTSVDAPTTKFNLLGSQVTFAGPVSGAGGFNCCNQPDGKIALSNSGNSYSGPSDFTLNSGGTLQLLANNALSPNSAVSIGGSTGGALDMGAFSGTAASFSGTSGSVLNITAGQTLTVTGGVTLNDTALTLTVIGNPALGTVYKILDKTSAGAISGTFNGVFTESSG